MQENNFNNLTPAQTERLAVLVEELGESVQAIGKILRHGLESRNPKHPEDSNRLDLEKELGDIRAAEKMLYAAGDLSEAVVKRSCDKKIHKPKRYLHHQPPHVAVPPAKVVVAGSRSWNDYAMFCQRLEMILKAVNLQDFVLVSGNAKRGADAMVIRYAVENSIPYETYDANWDKHGKSAGYIRNVEMAEVGTHVVVFWDGVSNGSKHMLNIAIERDLPTFMITVTPDAQENEKAL